ERWSVPARTYRIRLPCEVHVVGVHVTPPPHRRALRLDEPEAAEIDDVTGVLTTLPPGQKATAQDRVEGALVLGEGRCFGVKQRLQIDEHHVLAHGDDVLGVAVGAAE